MRAALDADELVGEVLIPKMSGRVFVSYVTSMGAEPLGKTDLSVDGAFRIAAPALEERSWLGGRLVVRVKDQHGRLAEGFVSITSFSITDCAELPSLIRYLCDTKRLPHIEEQIRSNWCSYS